MPHHRTTKANVLFIFLAASAFLVLRIALASPVTRAQQGEQVPKPFTGVAISVLSYVPKGVDFSSYTHDVSSSVMRNLSPKLPESAKNGGKGIVILRARIQKDGSLSEDGLTITTSSKRDDMDAASLNAIRAAAPFGPLPEAYSGANVELKFAFLFNIPQKPDARR